MQKLWQEEGIVLLGETEALKDEEVELKLSVIVPVTGNIEKAEKSRPNRDGK